jgi:hypothetical protein
VWVLHLDWLRESRWSLQRAKELDFLLADSPLNPPVNQSTISNIPVLLDVFARKDHESAKDLLFLDRKRPRANSHDSNVTVESSSSSEDDAGWLMKGMK